MGSTQGKNSKVDCIICLEKCTKGVYCETKQHFICSNCFVSYVESIFNDAGKLIDNGCKICCPEPNCTSLPWTTNQLRKLLTPETMEKYIDSLAHLVCMLDAHDKGIQFDENDLESASKAIIDSLTLGCPGCKIALDPTPDGCCAMRCGSCSKYFCFLCFKILPNSSMCHEHVRNCPQNPSKNVFAPLHIRDAAQKRLQIRNVQQTLRAKYGPHWRKSPNCKSILEKCRPILSTSGITLEKIFSADDALLDDPRMIPGPEYRHLFFAFLLGLFCMYILMSFRSSPVSSSTCPISSISESPSLLDDMDWNETVREPPFPLDSISDPPTQTWFFSIWDSVTYLFKGCCYALAINFFTNQVLVDVPLLAIPIILLWYPGWLVISYSAVIIFYIIYYLNFSIAILITAMMIMPRYRQQKNLVVSGLLWVCYFILSGFKAIFLST